MQIDSSVPVLMVNVLDSRALLPSSPAPRLNSISDTKAISQDAAVIPSLIRAQKTTENLFMAPLDELGTAAAVESAVLREEAGSGNISVKQAAALYAFNHSFDEQKAILDLLL